MSKVEPKLRGWKQIADFLGQPVATAQRWSKSGMPVRRSGRYVVAAPDELRRWVGHESGAAQPVEIAATGTDDLVAGLKRGLREARRTRAIHRVK
jgi:hypothetical protein